MFSGWLDLYYSRKQIPHNYEVITTVSDLDDLRHAVVGRDISDVHTLWAPLKPSPEDACSHTSRVLQYRPTRFSMSERTTTTVPRLRCPRGRRRKR